MSIAKQAPQPEQSHAEASVTVSLAPPPPTSFGLHIDMHLSVPQSDVLRRIAMAMDAKQERLANGLRVTNPTHALKRLLELVGER